MNDIRRVTTFSCALLICATLVGCSQKDTPSGTPDGEAHARMPRIDAMHPRQRTTGKKSIIDARCATCHKDGDIGLSP